MLSSRVTIFIATLTTILCLIVCVSFFFMFSVPKLELLSIDDPFDESKSYNSRPFRVNTYTVEIVPNIQKSTFDGTALLDIDILNETDTLVFDLGEEVKVSKCSHEYYHNTTNKSLVIKLDEVIKGKITVDCTYSSVISNSGDGLYATFDTVTNISGISTQFEPVYARTAFPCIDTPSDKGRFNLSLFAEGDLMAIANTPAIEIETKEMNGMKGRLYHFQITPVVSPYLVAFSVGKWDLVSGYTKRGVPVDVYTTPGQSKRGLYALQFAKDSIDFFEQYFGINYPLPRLQLASIPDFEAGAMENWGYITFRDIALLADETTAYKTTTFVAEVVVHENAHMWAGDLVSPLSWEYLWLNEGFATIMPMICNSKINPKYVSWEYFYLDTVQQALDFDFSSFTHPISVKVSNDEEVNSIFDEISYEKAGSILNMLRQLLGDDSFQKSLSSYFIKYQYQSTTTEELIQSFESTSGKKIRDFLTNWTVKAGFPTIHIKRTNDGYELSQRRLFLNGTEVPSVWPINITASNGKSIWLETEKGYFKSNELLTFNDGRLSYAFIEYDEQILNDLFNNWNTISESARWVLAADLYNLALAGKIKPDYLKKLIEKIAETKTESIIYMSIPAARILTSDESFLPNIADAFRDKLNFDYKNDSTILAPSIRMSLINLLVLKCNDVQSKEKLSQLDYTTVPNDLMAPILGLVAQTDFKKVKNIYLTSPISQEKIAALTAIGYVQSDEEINEAYHMILNEVKTHEMTTLYRSLIQNSKAGKLAFDWFINNFDGLYKRLSLNMQMNAMIQLAFSATKSENQIQQLCDLLLKPEFSAVERTVQQSRESTLQHIKLSNRIKNI